MSFEKVIEFERKISNYFGAPYAVAVDSCTHGIELCLRYHKVKCINVPVRTYISIPFLSHKLGIDLNWNKEPWQDYYFLTKEIADAAVLWKKNSYIHDKFMSISFQFQKHLNLGRGGIILCPDKKSYDQLKKMSYDGREPLIPWREQNIDTVGYHYYMTPETAVLGLEKLQEAISGQPKKWVYTDWPDLSKMKVFQKFESEEN
jgi:dTDP-4-amino-4,6-dideoxygalactose transaminase